MTWRILRGPEGGEGGGDKGVADDKDKGGDKGADLVKAVEGLISRHGDPTAALRVLMGENYTLRDKVREVSARLPKDGALVLEGEDAKHWGAYKTLGAPNELKRVLEEHGTLKADNRSFRKADVVRSASDIHGFKAKVLGTLAEKLEIEIGESVDDEGKLVGLDDKPIRKDGKAVLAAFVKGEGETRTRLDKYASAHWEDYMPSLKPAAETRQSSPFGTPTTRPPGPSPIPSGTGDGKPKVRRPISSF